MGNYKLVRGVNDQLLSKSIDYIRWPLTVIIVLFHSKFQLPFYNSDVTAEKVPIFSLVTTIIDEEIRFPVALFLILSGFLFFYNINELSFNIYKSKIKSRVKTLLIPYFFWNLAAIGVAFLIQLIVPSSFRGTAKLITEFCISDWITALWGGEYPYNIPLWYIRNLMVLSLLSPFVYLIIKYLKIYGVLAFGLFSCFQNGLSFPGFNVSSAFFFSLGAYFSYIKFDFVSFSERYKLVFLSLFIILIVIFLTIGGHIWFDYLRNINIVVEIGLITGFSAYILKKNDERYNEKIHRSGFFIYCFHYIVLQKIIIVLFRVINPMTNVEMFLIYLLAPTAVILVGIGIYSLLKRFMPRFTAVVTGSR